jgi:hypothetical protein
MMLTSGKVKLEWIFGRYCTDELSLLPETFKRLALYLFLEPTITINLAFTPLPIVFISILIKYSPSTIFFAIGKVPIIIVPALYDFNTMPVSLELSVFI